MQRALELGGLDGLVCCHGIAGMAPILEFPIELWQRQHDVNSTSVFFLCQAAAPHIREGGGIVILGSISGKLAATTQNPAYNASKAGIMVLTRTLAYALAPSVRVNCISPGIIETPHAGGGDGEPERRHGHERRRAARRARGRGATAARRRADRDRARGAVPALA